MFNKPIIILKKKNNCLEKNNAINNKFIKKCVLLDE